MMTEAGAACNNEKSNIIVTTQVFVVIFSQNKKSN
jgi:hypothetical protein